MPHLSFSHHAPMASRLFIAALAATVLTACAPRDNGAVLGGPAADPPAGSQAEFREEIGDRIYFDLGKATIRPDMFPIVRRQAAWLKRHPGYIVTVQGHGDERGTREANFLLAERRAIVLRDALVVEGVEPTRTRIVSLGEERPQCLADTERCYALNRKAVVVLNEPPAG